MTTFAEPRTAGDDDVATPAGTAGFQLRLENFSGPFEVLLSLINRRSLDITEVALAAVTDEFISHLRSLADRMGTQVLDETTEFLVIASTLLDLKAARLLPRGEVEDEEDLARLEARDLLFARLLQYKAYKEAAGTIAALFEAGSAHVPRQVAADDPEVTRHLPELEWSTSPADLVRLAAKAMAPKAQEPDGVDTTHVHVQPVSVAEQAGLVAAKLREAGALSFTALTEDADASLVVVARFLALLEMYRDRAVGFEQVAPLTELLVRWIDTGQWEGAVEEYTGQEPDGGEARQESE